MKCRALELQWIPELYHLTKALADIVIPQVRTAHFFQLHFLLHLQITK